MDMSAATRPATSLSLPGSKAEINLLLVDDNGDFAQLLCSGLCEIDTTLNIDVATTPETAVEILEKAPVDCVLSDYKMQPINGLHLLQIVREEYGNLPFILYTSHGNESVASTAISKGATDYVTKKSGADHYQYLATLIRTAVENYYDNQLQSRRESLAQLTEARGNTGGFEIDTTHGIVLITRGATETINAPNTKRVTKPEFYGLFNDENTTQLKDAISTVLETNETITETIHRNTNSNSTQILQITLFQTQSNTQSPDIRGVIKDITMDVRKENQMEVFDRVLRHNLRNDLNLIRGHAEMIAADTTEETSQHGQKIITESNQLLDSVSKQRDIMELLRTGPTYENIDVISELQAIHEDMSSAYEHADISITADSTVSIYTSNRLPDAIMELVENAIVHNTTQSPRVTIDVTQTKQKLKIRVTDNAEVIPEMERSVLLEPGERTPLYHGSGLGLWLIKLITRECGGNITFEENAPHGNIIQLTIPR